MVIRDIHGKRQSIFTPQYQILTDIRLDDGSTKLPKVIMVVRSTAEFLDIPLDSKNGILLSEKEIQRFSSEKEIPLLTDPRKFSRLFPSMERWYFLGLSLLYAFSEYVHQFYTEISSSLDLTKKADQMTFRSRAGSLNCSNAVKGVLLALLSENHSHT